jgi:aldose 1-epimerase
VATTLRTRNAIASILPGAGGRLSSLVIHGAEVLGRGVREPGLPAGWYGGSFPMVPYAGRLKHARFEFEGEEYRLPANAGDHAGHGLVFDVPWRVVGRPTGQRLVLATRLDERWPFGGEVTQTFVLDDHGLSVSLELSNESRSMPAGLGFHPWFRRDLGSGPVSLDFDPARRLAPMDDGFPGPAVPDLGGRPWDDVFTGVRASPGLAWPDGPRVRIHSTSDTWIVFERQPDDLCVEPILGAPNSLGEASSPTVGPGRPLTLTMRFDWGP